MPDSLRFDTKAVPSRFANGFDEALVLELDEQTLMSLSGGSFWKDMAYVGSFVGGATGIGGLAKLGYSIFKPAPAASAPTAGRNINRQAPGRSRDYGLEDAEHLNQEEVAAPNNSLLSTFAEEGGTLEEVGELGVSFLG